MNNLATALARIAMLAGGAVVGALLARWCDEFFLSHAQEKSEYDRNRYAQGLTPQSLQPPIEESQA